MSIKTKDFKSFAYTIPPPGQIYLARLRQGYGEASILKPLAQLADKIDEAWGGIEPPYKGFAVPCLTTWLPGHNTKIVTFCLRFIKLLYNEPMKVGIFDSGLGGLFLTKAITETLPEYDYIYLGDTKNLPYGNRSREAVYELTEAAVDYLFRNDCELVILACNTASALALRKLQREYLPKHFPDRKILGVLIPMAEAAAEKRSRSIGVLGTIGTIESGAFIEEIRKIDPDVEIVQSAAPLLVPLIENNGMEWSNPILKEYLDPLRNADSIILGCTHYSIIRGEIERFLDEEVQIICQTDVVPEKLRQYLNNHPEMDAKLSKNGNRNFFVTDITTQFLELALLWFGDDVELELVEY